VRGEHAEDREAANGVDPHDPTLEIHGTTLGHRPVGAGEAPGYHERVSTDLDLGGLPLDEAEREIYAHILSRSPEHAFAPTLDRMRDVCDLLGHPERAYRVVHVAGTNGKTSTARMTESLVRAHGLRAGLFTSPHLTSVRERIRIDGEPINAEDFVRLWLDVAPIVHLADTRSLNDGGPRLSFFEVLATLAFAAFADAPVDVAVVEVGMGGSWDATNVCDGEVAVIAPVALDHAEYLGTDLAGIAREKAGIVKPGASVVVAEQAEAAARVIREAVAAAGAMARWEGEELEVVSRVPAVGGQVVSLSTGRATYENVSLPLLGEHQAHNALLALVATEDLMGGVLDGDVVADGLANATSPGRLEVVRTSPLVVVDAAHNPHGAAALGDALEESFVVDPLVAVVGILADKDAEGILAALEPVASRVVVTASLSPRALDPETLGAVAAAVFGDERVDVVPHLPDAIDRAVALAEADPDARGGVVVTGSITLVAEARILLGADREGAAR
jgi:dihydrofolate synthase/folylpolyglutamate synthase